MTKALDHLNLAVHVVINDLAIADEGDHPEAWAVHSAAYKLVELEHRALPCRIELVPEHGGPIEVERFELCGDDVYIEDRGGKQAWSITFFASKELPLETQQALRDLVVSAYERAARGLGATVRYSDTTIWRQWRVTETTVAEGV